MSVAFSPAPAELAADYIRLRGQTRENAIAEDRLRSMGITAETWAQGILSAGLQGFVAHSDQELIGYCFGDVRSGEIVVLAVRPAFEGKGTGRRLLNLVVGLLRGLGHRRLFLACSPDPTVRSHGFYRRLGWRSTGTVDQHGDEILELAGAGMNVPDSGAG